MKEFIKKFYKNNFVYNGTEKLSKLTIFFIILLDRFCLPWYTYFSKIYTGG